MSKILRVYNRIVIDDGSSAKGSGSTDYPVGQVTLTGDFDEPEGDFPVPAGQGRILVNPINRVTWEYLQFVMIGGSSTIDGWYKTDTPTSSTDRNPSGTYPRWHSFSLNCYKPVIIDPRVRINPTLATDVGDSGGVPLAMDDAATVNGYVYAVYFKNRGSTDVVVRRTWLN